MGSRSKQLGSSAPRVHLRYATFVQRRRRMATAAEPASEPCAVCDAKKAGRANKNKHTYRGLCEKNGQIQKKRAAPGATAAAKKAAKEARLAGGGASSAAAVATAPSSPPPRLSHIHASSPNAMGFFDPDTMRANQQREAQVRHARRTAGAAATATATATATAAHAETSSPLASLAVPAVATAVFVAAGSALRAIYRRVWTVDVPVDDAADDGTMPPSPRADDDEDEEGNDDGDEDDDAATAKAAASFAKLAASASKIPPAALAVLDEMKGGLRATKLPEWARAGYMMRVGTPIKFDEHGRPLEPHPEDWSAADRRYCHVSFRSCAMRFSDLRSTTRRSMYQDLALMLMGKTNPQK